MPPPPKRRRIVSERGDLVKGFGRSEHKGGRRHPRDDDHAVKTSASVLKAPQRREQALSDDESSSEDGNDQGKVHKLAYASLLSALCADRSCEENGVKLKQRHGNEKHAPSSGNRAKGADRESDLEDDQVNEDENSEAELLDAADEVGATDNYDVDDAMEPFQNHFANPDARMLARSIKEISDGSVRVDRRTGRVGKSTSVIPASHTAQSNSGSTDRLPGVAWKKRLEAPYETIRSRYKQQIADLGSHLFIYQDILYSGRTVHNAESLRNLTCAHTLNHVLKTRDRVIKNSARLAHDQGHVGLELRDQGFTRPKVVVLVETRQACARYMHVITEMFAPEQQENKKRFEDAFVQTEVKYSDDRPADFRELFEGNDDNEFRLGVKFTRKSIKYYSQFYDSDIIFASPLGLRRAINAGDPKRADCDFLSSIEILVIDQADAMLMQNWEHVEFALEHFNLQPKEAHGCDFSRVRQYYLDGDAKYLRQTIVFSAYLTPELNNLFSSQMQNVAGKVRIAPEYSGTIADVGLPVRQTFNRYHSRSPLSDPDDRFKYFTTTIVPFLNRQLPSSGEGLGALIFVPSYLDFVRVRNYFSTSTAAENLTFGSLSEYTDVADSRRTRSYFFMGRQNVMLYTGRAHHFRRYQLRGVKSVVMYGVPENPIFYHEMIGGFLGDTTADGAMDATEASVRVMFSKWDGLALERIVGTKRVGKMLKETAEDVFVFT